ncbi:hypothetical protein D0T50_00410 [Bacteroides sp. 214]|uniref:hypothetical protein n=1 Tax=Bacteroides sp. 214 TaxID=2302935 RepID=UPI0013D2DDBB|nr:hypothetical protein [Bacteroides sp. 214]NDW11351.1 hypothetical protein [Bacteroides sp. 214]
MRIISFAKKIKQEAPEAIKSGIAKHSADKLASIISEKQGAILNVSNSERTEFELYGGVVEFSANGKT